MPGPLPTSPVHERLPLSAGKRDAPRGKTGRKAILLPLLGRASVATTWLGRSSGWLISGGLHLVLAALLAHSLFQDAGPGAESGIDSGWQMADASPAAFDAPVLTGPLVATSGESGGGADLTTLTPLEMTPVVTGLKPGEGGSGISPLAGIGGGVGTGAGGAGGGAPGVGFFGTSSRAASVVFVVDMSGSMEGGRFARAKQELVRSIHKLEPSQKFSVVFFNIGAFPLFYPKSATTLIEATKANKRRSTRWINTREPGFATDPVPALKYALALEPEVVYFLTDGEIPPIVQWVAKTSNTSRTVIHTVAFHGREGESILRAIAEESQGTYRFVK